ncbi:MAG: hypothetical protein QM751_03035 [Paludibacteraceae bacterium]
MGNDGYETVVIISGLEPQRSVFEKYMIEKLLDEAKPTLIIQGLPSKENGPKRIENITLIAHLKDEELALALKGCRKIICRAGYSTLMDLSVLNCLEKAVFYPTPGQTEQQYLAEYHTKK